MGPDRCRIIGQYLYWPKLLHVVVWYCCRTWHAELFRGVIHLDIFLSYWLFKVSQPALRECIIIFIFILSKKDVTFSLIVGPVMGFPSEHIAVRHVRNTLSSCTDLRCFQCLLLEEVFHTFTWCHKSVMANYGPRARCGTLRGSIRPAADFKIIV